jgi:hypothetical protein
MVYFRFPCKDCTERTVDCHGKCERYQAAQKEHQRIKNEVQKGKADEDSFVEYKVNIIYKTRRKLEGRK